MAILEQSTAKYGEEVESTTATMRNRYKAAYEDFQNSWGNIVNTILIPVLEYLTQIFDIMTTGLNTLSNMSGGILQIQQNQEETTNEIDENIKKQTKNQKKYNKELKKGLASFDEINTLSEQISENLSTENNQNNSDHGGSQYQQEINPTLMAIMGAVGVSLMAIGCILLFTGNIAWGIGFIIAGAFVFGVTAANIKSDAISQKTKDELSNAIIIAGIVAYVLGVLLCFAQRWDLGIGLIAIGATTTGISISLNWNSIKQKIENVAEENKGLFVLGSILLVVIGVALLFTGVGVPFGLAWIAAGAQGISTGITGSWDFLPKKIKEVWQKIKSFWNEHIKPVFTLQWWRNLATACGNGLIWGFEGAVNGIITLFEKMINIVVNGLNKIQIELPDWDILGDLAGATFGIDIPEADLCRISIPRLAQGAVIPPNREFMAILGDNKRENEIVSPVSTMKQAVAEVLAQANIGGGFNGRIEVPVIIDGREIARAVREAEGSMGTQTVFGGFANVY
jgi:hypothetical protein